MDNIRFGRFRRTASDAIDGEIARVLADGSFYLSPTGRNFHRMTIARGSHAACSFGCAAESELRLVAYTRGDFAWTQIGAFKQLSRDAHAPTRHDSANNANGMFQALAQSGRLRAGRAS